MRDAHDPGTVDQYVIEDSCNREMLNRDENIKTGEVTVNRQMMRSANVRRSLARRRGSSIAAKCPPRGISVQ